jgi:1,4-alpha-glucan branching enzyme
MASKKGHKQPKKRIYFNLEVTDAEEVRLVGSFNNWDPEGRLLKRNKGLTEK